MSETFAIPMREALLACEDLDMLQQSVEETQVQLNTLREAKRQKRELLAQKKAAEQHLQETRSECAQKRLLQEAMAAAANKKPGKCVKQALKEAEQQQAANKKGGQQEQSVVAPPNGSSGVPQQPFLLGHMSGEELKQLMLGPNGAMNSASKDVSATSPYLVRLQDLQKTLPQKLTALENQFLEVDQRCYQITTEITTWLKK